MSRGINKVILIGNCCADPEVKYLPSGGAVTNISIATNEQWKDKATGQKQERSEFHRIVFFNRLAEIAGEYLKKGSKCYIEGSLRTRKWQAQDGSDRYSTEVVASEMQMLDSKQGGEGEKQYWANNGDPAQSSQRQAEPQGQPAQESQSHDQAQSWHDRQKQAFDSFDDDIPFMRLGREHTF